VDPYPVLGVAPDVSDAELRRAYLRLARKNHPDSHPADRRGAAERRMQDINAAWALVGDPQKRRQHDRSVRATSSDGPTTPGSRTNYDADRRAWMHDPNHPYWSEGAGADPFDFLDNRPLTTAGGRGNGRPLAIVPPALVLGGLALLFFGVAISAGGIVVMGFFSLVFGGLAFLIVPFMDMAKSRRQDRL
jgi:hypothetical protein